ncbi:hypothetical protein B0I71DRAFT_62642, partial [Yarrowia lipolytica]
TTATTECFSSTIYGMCQSTPIPQYTSFVTGATSGGATVIDENGRPFLEETIVPQTITGLKPGTSTMRDDNGVPTGLVITSVPEWSEYCEPDTTTEICHIVDRGYKGLDCNNACQALVSGIGKCPVAGDCWCNFFADNAQNVDDCRQCRALNPDNLLQKVPVVMSNMESCGLPTTASSSCVTSTVKGACTSLSVPPVKPEIVTGSVPGFSVSTDSLGDPHVIQTLVPSTVTGATAGTSSILNSDGDVTGVVVTTTVPFVPDTVITGAVPGSTTLVDEDGNSHVIETIVPTTVSGDTPGTSSILDDDGIVTAVIVTETPQSGSGAGDEVDTIVATGSEPGTLTTVDENGSTHVIETLVPSTVSGETAGTSSLTNSDGVVTGIEVTETGAQTPTPTPDV